MALAEGAAKRLERPFLGLELGGHRDGDAERAAETDLAADEYFRQCQEELDVSAAFTLIAAAEGRVRLDLLERVNAHQDQLGMRFKVLTDPVRQSWLRQVQNIRGTGEATRGGDSDKRADLTECDVHV